VGSTLPPSLPSYPPWSTLSTLTLTSSPKGSPVLSRLEGLSGARPTGETVHYTLMVHITDINPREERHLSAQSLLQTLGRRDTCLRRVTLSPKGVPRVCTEVSSLLRVYPGCVRGVYLSYMPLGCVRGVYLPYMPPCGYNRV